MTDRDKQKATAKRKRQGPISFRPPADKRAELYALQLKSGLSMNAFLCEAVFGGEAVRKYRRVSAEQAELAKLLAMAASIKDQLSQASSLTDAETQSALDDITALRQAVFDTLGRST